MVLALGVEINADCLTNGWVDRQMYKGLNAHSEKSNRRLRLNIIEYVLRVHVSS